MKSVISSENARITNSAFTPIILHPATDFTTIYTSMKNYQDILNQRNIPYGPLWCEEGVYRIAKEIQLLRPNEFGNIFLGMGGFHTVWTRYREKYFKRRSLYSLQERWEHIC